ncbi:MAG: PAS domain-containing sensor histidine kinase [Holosporaceae bacterium]|jgi:signal transduction histidine kinase|nr:PAS domain-containing sensor histidine kinase [Holosporaceae bacterium]
MCEGRYVRWSEKAQLFFEAAECNSIVLEIIISYGCASQSGEGFDDLVNSLNSEGIRQKIKKINIVDTSYLYRHVIPDFAQYIDSNIKTLWFLKNKNSIEKLAVETTLIGWKEGISTDSFQHLHKQIKQDFGGDSDGNNIIREFRDLVISDASVAAYKGNNTLENSIDFLLEEIAYVCANFHGIPVVVYPMKFICSMSNAMNRYGVGVNHLRYKISKHAQKECKNTKLDMESVDAEVLYFMKETISNVNFFVIDKYGNQIYKNYALDKVIGDLNAKELSEEVWEINTEVMDTKKQKIVEEEYRGIKYLSVKAPLIINDKVEGIIGLAVDVTDRKRVEYLELQNHLQKRAKDLSEQVAHDINSPLIALSMAIKNCQNLPERDYVALRNALTNIESVAVNLLRRCGKNEKSTTDVNVDRYIFVDLSLQSVLDGKRYQHKGVTFNYLAPEDHAFVFIQGDYSAFYSMISNLVNNSAEATEGQAGVVDVSFDVVDDAIEIRIKDNGKGMLPEIIKRLENNVPISSTKKKGHGIGMQQVRSALKSMWGKMLIESTKDVGTEITLVFPKSEPPAWLAAKIILHRGDCVVVLDDDPSIHDIWKNRLANYHNEITIVYFTTWQKIIDFLSSVPQKSKIFLLADYELRNQDMNGAEIIEKCNLQKQSVLVTSANISTIENFKERCKHIKMLPKEYIGDISILMRKRQEYSVDLLLIDDEESFIVEAGAFAKEHMREVVVYSNIDEFLNNLHKYPKDTKIAIERDLKDKSDSFKLARRLYNVGYMNLYMMSKEKFEEEDVKSYCNIIFKDMDSIKRLLAV